MSPEHVAHPYPTEQEKAQIMAETGIELKQLTNWFVNNRKRYWKPRVEAKLQKFQPNNGSSVGAGGTQTHAALPGGGLSIAIHHMNPKQPQVPTSFPMLPGDASSSSAAAPPPFAQAGASVEGGPASPHAHAMVGPAAMAASRMAGAQQAVAGGGGAYHEDDPHTISEGSGSSTCNSDDDSIDTSSCANRHPTFGGTASQYLDSRLASVSSPASMTASLPRSGSGYRRHEEVDVHVLRPETSRDGNNSEEPLPTLRDLTIKASVPKERILATFKCPISYTIPYEIEHDRKKVQSRRDGEVLRVKKHYLKLYLATRGIHSVSSPVGGAGCEGHFSAPSSSASSVSSAGNESTAAVATQAVHAVTPLSAAFSIAAATAPAVPALSSRTRAFTCTDLSHEDNSNPAPRKRARTSSGSLMKGDDEWRELCQNARSLFCESLPGLEEAARMFGYVSQ